MSKYVWIFGLLLILSSLLATAADKTPGETQPSRLTDIRQESTKTSPTRVTKTLEQMGYISMQDDVLSRGHPVVDGLKSARIDTVYLLGCGTYPNYGDFEDEEGNPSMDGWIGYDYTAPDSSNWHIDTFNCAALDPATPDNHAWWCGQIFEPCSPEDVPGGYGNEWLDYLDWYGTVPDPLSNVTVRVTAMLNYDNEPGYDFLYLEHENGSGMQPIATFNGSNRDENGEFVPVVFEESFNLNPVDYVGDSSDQVHLRWHFQSDGGWSDEDCWGPTDGAAQIDLIEVYFDQGSGQIQVGTTETCESSDPQQWETVLAPGCGNFAKIWPHLHDIDPCFSNNTPVAAFIDDGVVVPGTGGYLCTTWCYGPSGYIVNPEGGLRGPDFHLRNEIWSPILQWPGSQYIRATLSADVYRHESLCSVCPGIFFTPLVRTTADPTGASGWTEWILYDYIYFGGPSWKRITSEWTGFWPEHPEFAQVSLLVWELGWFYGYTGTDGTPAPYFDNICIRVWADTGPDLWIADPRQLAQDNFPEIGTIDYVNLAENHVRFDAGQFDVETHTARDYIRVYLSTLRPGSVIFPPVKS